MKHNNMDTSLSWWTTQFKSHIVVKTTTISVCKSHGVAYTIIWYYTYGTCTSIPGGTAKHLSPLSWSGRSTSGSPSNPELCFWSTGSKQDLTESEEYLSTRDAMLILDWWRFYFLLNLPHMVNFNPLPTNNRVKREFPTLTYFQINRNARVV